MKVLVTVETMRHISKVLRSRTGVGSINHGSRSALQGKVKIFLDVFVRKVKVSVATVSESKSIFESLVRKSEILSDSGAHQQSKVHAGGEINKTRLTQCLARLHRGALMCLQPCF